MAENKKNIITHIKTWFDDPLSIADRLFPLDKI